MQDPFQDVDVGGDGLRVEEVVGEEGDAVLEVCGELFLEDRCYLGQVLDYDFEVGIGFGEGDVVVAR